MDRSQRYRSALRPSARLPHIFCVSLTGEHPLSQLARAVALSRVLRPVLSTLSRQSSRRSERCLARRTISAYPVCIHVSSFLFLVLISSNHIPFARLAPSENHTWSYPFLFCRWHRDLPQHLIARWPSGVIPRTRADHPRLSSDVGHILCRVRRDQDPVRRTAFGR